MKRKQSGPSATGRIDFWLIVLLTLSAAGLRLIDINSRSLWMDEGFTLSRVFDSWTHLFQNYVNLQGIDTIDLHPFVYFAVLKVWGQTLGYNLFALRLVSPAAAVVLVPLTYVWARRVLSRRASVVAALFAVLSPSYQWYGWEVRMYVWVPMMAALTSYLFTRACQTRQRAVRWWVAWFIASVFACLSHFALISIVVAQMFVLLLLAGRNGRTVFATVRTSRRIQLAGVLGLACLVLVVAVPALIFPTAFLQPLRIVNNMVAGIRFEGVAVGPYLVEMIGGATLGLNAADWTGGWLLALVGVSALISAVGPRWQPHEQSQARRTFPMLIPASEFVGPLVFWLLAAFVVDNRPSFRYLIVMVPALHLLLARWAEGGFALIKSLRPLKLAALSAWMRLTAAAVLVAVTLLQGYGLYQAFQRTGQGWYDDWESVGRVIRQNWQPGDVILINLLTPEVPLKVYLRGVPVEMLPDLQILYNMSLEKAHEMLGQRYQRIWFANSGRTGVENQHSTHPLLNAYHLRDRWKFNSRSTIIDLILFDTHAPTQHSLPAEAHGVEASETQTSIAGYALHPGSRYDEQPSARLTLYWRRGTIREDVRGHSVSFRLSYQSQVWWDWMLPGELDFAPADWSPGELYAVDYFVPLPLGLPNLPYQLRLDARAGEKAEVFQAVPEQSVQNEVACCLRIVDWSLPPSENTFSTGVMQTLNLPINSPVQTLLPPQSAFAWTPHEDVWHGVGVTLVASEFPETIRPGQVLNTVLTWQPDQPNLEGWDTHLQLEPLLSWPGTKVAEVRQAAATQDFPTRAWPVGQPVRDAYAMSIPFGTPTGLYRLALSRWRASAPGAQIDSAWIGVVRIENYPSSPVPTAQQIAHPVNASAGEIRLLGYSVEQPIARAVTLNFHTYWQVDAQPTRDGVLFLHSDRDSCRPTCPQDDNPPERGLRSTLSYRPGDGIDQIHQLVLPADAPGGEYKLYAGIYDREGFARWPATNNGTPAQDDLIYIGSFTLPDLPPPPDYRYRIYLPSLMR